MPHESVQHARPIRLAILGCRGIPARYGGFETFAEKLAIGLVQRGHHVTVYAEGSGGDTSYQGVHIRHIPTPRWGAMATVLYDVKSLWNARSEFDIVYMLGYGAAFACVLPKWFGTIVWINIDGLEWRRSKWSWLQRRYLRSMEWISSRVSDLVIADAQAIQSHYQETYPNGAPSVFLPYGADLPVRSRSDTSQLAHFGLNAGSYDLVVARLEPENHIAMIIEAHAASNSGMPLVILGDHTVNTQYVQSILKIKHPLLFWLGSIFDPTILDALRLNCRIYLHGHSVGGTNPSLLEAMAAGCAILAHDNPFNREVLAQAGQYFPDQASLKKLLTEIKPDQLSGFRVTAKQRVTLTYTWQSVVEQYETQLHGALQP